MSEQKQPQESSPSGENLNPEIEVSANEEMAQAEESVPAINVEILSSTLDSLNYDNPNFDLVLGQLATNKISPSKRAAEDDEEGDLERTTDQIANLQRAVKRMAFSEDVTDLNLEPQNLADPKLELQNVTDQKPEPQNLADPKPEPQNVTVPKAEPENTVDPKADSKNAADQKADSVRVADQMEATSAANQMEATESAANQMEASGSSVQASAPFRTTSLELPVIPRSLIYDRVRREFPQLFTKGNRLRDIYGVTTVHDLILLDSHNRLLYVLYQHRAENRGPDVENLLSQCLITELKRLYSLGCLKNIVMQGDINNYSVLFPAKGQYGRMVCASLVLGFTLLAFANYTLEGRERRLRQLTDQCRANGIALPHEAKQHPLHPVARMLQCVSVSYTEMKLYVQALKDAINHFSTNNIACITEELDELNEE